MLTPNPDWWCFDTAHVTVSDVQVEMSSGWSVWHGHLLHTSCSSLWILVVNVPVDMFGWRVQRGHLPFHSLLF